MPKTPSVKTNRVLIFIYAILAFAALGRSSFELATKFAQAPLPYGLSALAALLYVLITLSLIKDWRKAALIALALELLFVVGVGLAGMVDSELFPAKTVWSNFGVGYGFMPLIMPIVGLFYLRDKDR